MSYSRAVDLARALQAYAIKQKPPKEKVKGFETTSATSDVAKLIQAGGLRKNSFDNLFPTMFSIHGIDINNALTRSVKDGDITPRAKDLATLAFNTAIETLSKKYSTMTPESFRDIDTSIQHFINIFNEGGTDSLDSSKLSRLDIAAKSIKSIFSEPLIVQYIEGTPDSFGSIKIAFSSFNNLRSQVNLVIKKELAKVLLENKVTNSKLSDDTYLTTKVFNWGHTAVEDSGGSKTLLSGKLIAEMLSAEKLFRSNTDRDKAYSLISRNFIETTGQENTVIKLHHGSLTKGDPIVLSLVISSGIFQSAIVQSRRENQEDLSQAEAKWKLGNFLKSSSALVSEAFGVNNVGDLVGNLLRMRSSPSILDKIGTNFGNLIKGLPIVKGTKVVPLLNKQVPIKKKRVSVSVKHPKNTLRATPNIRTVQGKFYSLASLQLLINSQLQDVISANMGDGSSRNTLNYRTGRFAASASVTKMSQSREGMITAFYTYMKNPYQTFEPGFKQGSPKTRDPKLLIGRSIRDIAATKVANTLRAISV